VDVKQAMRGAMRGLADGLDADSAFLTPELVKTFETNSNPGRRTSAAELVRQYYLRVVSARDGSPRAKAGPAERRLHPCDRREGPRDMSAFEGMRLLHGAAGTKVMLLVIRGNAADPHEMTSCASVGRRRCLVEDGRCGTGYVRVQEFSKDSPARIKQAFESLAKTGASRYIVDLRGNARAISMTAWPPRGCS
jgi:carboxyl-terminal processing protease